MSTRRKSNPNDPSFIPTPAWQRTVLHTRHEAMRVIHAIRDGSVDEVDLEKLQNFVQFACALMEMEGPAKWSLAKVNAELLFLAHPTTTIPDHATA